MVLDVLLYPDFPSRIFATHIADLAKNWPLWAPSSVVATEHPKNAAIRIRVTAVQGVFVIQLDHDVECIAR